MTKRDFGGADLILVLGDVCNKRAGKWLLQVTAIVAGTVTPSISADGGTTFVPIAMQPVAGGAVVANAAATGAWWVEGSGGIVRLVFAGTSATVFVEPCCLA